MQTRNNIFRILIIVCVVLFVGVIAQQFYISHVETSYAKSIGDELEAGPGRWSLCAYRANDTRSSK